MIGVPLSGTMWLGRKVISMRASICWILKQEFYGLTGFSLRINARNCWMSAVFLSHFPLTMKRLGFDVSVAEKFDCYGGALDSIAAHLVGNDIQVIDSDFTLENETEEWQFRSPDGVSCMVVAGHLAQPRVQP